MVEVPGWQPVVPIVNVVELPPVTEPGPEIIVAHDGSPETPRFTVALMPLTITV
jgi:hypothetical protein